MIPNNIVREISPKSIFDDATAVIDATVSFNQGDHLVFNTTSKLLAKPALEADCATYCGIARLTVVNGKVQSPYNTDVVASQAIQAVVGPVYGVVAKMVAKTGDSFTAGCEVFADPTTGTRGVTVTGTKAIGVYQGKAITAVAGQEVEILIGARYSNDALKF